MSLICTSNMSSKNDLQEYFQKRKLKLPVYTTIRAGGSAHNPKWVSQVTLSDGRIFVSSPHSGKKSAEAEAAADALKSIERDGVEVERPEPDFRLSFDDHCVCVLIDVENQPAALGELVNRTWSRGMSIHAFYSKGHPLGRKIDGTEYVNDDRVTIHEVPSTRNDGADVGMMVTLGMMLETSNFTTYIIISNDHFAEAAADVARGYHLMSTPGSKSHLRFKAAASRDVTDALQKLRILQESGRLSSV